MTESAKDRRRRRANEYAAMRPGDDVFGVPVEAHLIGATLLSALDDVARDHPGNQRLMVVAMGRSGRRVTIGRRVDKWDPDLMQAVIDAVEAHRLTTQEDT